VPFGQGSYGSRTYSVEGAVIYQAAQVIKAKALAVGAYMLKAAESDVVYEDGKVSLKKDPAQSKTLQDIASWVWFAWDLPPGMEPGLEATEYFNPSDFNFPFGSHVAVVEVDEETGAVDVVKYVCVDDVGNVINPLIVEGQVHGGLAQGIAQALFEEAVYDESGTLLSGSFAEYQVPSAADLPSFTTGRTETPATGNPLGVKGVGEAGTIASTPAVVNAVLDAVRQFGVRDIEMPLTPMRVWRAVHTAQGGAR
jgi:carbon-monoxide dehydrogenase large subunit